MDIRLSEVVAALSKALDITHGQPPGHATRACLIGMRIAGALGHEVLAIMRQDAGTKLDGDVFLALEDYLPRYRATPAGRDAAVVVA